MLLKKVEGCGISSTRPHHNTMAFQKLLVCQDAVLVNDLGIFLPYLMMCYISRQG